MQRYRVNYKLFAGLIVGVIVAAGAVYAARQVNNARNADDLLARANDLEKKGDLAEATRNLENYLAFRKDDVDSQIRLGQSYIKLARENVIAGEPGNAMAYRKRASTLLAKYSEHQELRRDLVDLDLKQGFFQYEEFNKETAAHIGILLESNRDDAELIEGLAFCYVFQKQPEKSAAELNKLVGYDPKSQTFDLEQAIAPNRLEAYQIYSQVAFLPQGAQIPSLNDFRLARAMVDQMVAANPDKAEAYLHRGIWYSRYDQGAGSRYDFESLARQDLLKAVELDPESAFAIHAVASHFIKLARNDLMEADKARDSGNAAAYEEHKAKSEELLNTARDYYEQGLKVDPTHAEFYVHLANLERLRNDKTKSDEIINQGLRKLEGKGKTRVMLSQADYFVQDNKFEEARKLIEQLKNSLPPRHPYLASLQGKYSIQKGDFKTARDIFKELVPRVGTDKDLKVDALNALGLCHQRLAEPELARKCYEQVIAIDPENGIARGNLARLIIRPAVASKQPGPSDPNADVNSRNFIDLMTKEAAKPEGEQNWAPIEKFLKSRAEIEKFSPTREKMAMAEYYRFRKMYDQSERLLSEALKAANPDPESSEQTDVLLAAVNLAAVNPKRGPDAALKMMDDLIARFGDNPMFKIQRVRLLGARNDERMVEDVLALTKETEGWDKRHVDTLWAIIATMFEQTRHPEEAELALKEVARLREGDLPIRIRLFKSALARNDNEGMQAAQEEILEIVGSKKDTNWAYTEAARLFATGNSNDTERQEEVSRLLSAIIREREDWHEPYLLRAKLKLTKGDAAGSLADFEKGLSLGQGNLVDYRAYSQLLIAQNRWADVVALVEPLGLDSRIFVLGENYAKGLFLNERFTDAMEAAERTIALATPAPAELQVWYAQFLDSIIAVPIEKIPADERARFADMQKDCRAKQSVAIDEAIKLRPDSPNVWLFKVRHRLLTNQSDEAIATAQAAQLLVEEDVEPLLMAECYTVLGRWFDAENVYLGIFSQNPDNTTVARQLGDFYLSQIYSRPDKIEKATRLINMILEKSAKKDDSVPEADAQWARRAAARVLAAKRDYQSLRDAEKLLASNSKDGVLPVADKLEMASILAPRPEQVSKLKAIQLLEEIQGQITLNTQQDLILAQLYFQTDNWRNARALMERLTAQHPKSPEVRAVYVNMLLTRNQAAERQTLETQLRQLRTIDPTSLTTLELTAKVADRQGKGKEARDSLRKLVPQDFSKLDANATVLVVKIAELLSQLGDFEGAEVIYTRLANREGARSEQKGVLAQFVGTYRDPAAGFEMLENLQHDIPPVQLIEAASRIVAAHRETIGEGYDERVERWLSRALREDPESYQLALKKASFRELQGKYDETAAIYREVLKRDDVAPSHRAMVLNNLGYMIGLGIVEATRSNEAVELINEAVRLLGPGSDILDTRAVIYMKRQDFKSAVEDLKLAVIDAPTDSKYFHLALAHLGLGQNAEAKAAWEQAVSLGLTRDSIGKFEQEEYDRAEAKIKAN